MAQYRQPVPPMSDPTHDSLSREDRQRPRSPDTEASSGRLIGWAQRALRWVGWSVAGVVSMLLLAAAALYGVLLPRAGEWRPDIEREASRAFGVPVQIGRIAIQSEGWNPTLEISDIVFLDNRQRPALRLPRIEAVVSVQSLLALQLRFDWLVIEDAALEIRRDAQGRLHVAGLDMATAESEPEAEADFDAADWLMRQGQLVIRRGQLRWVDEMRRAPPLALSDVDVVLRNGLRRHEIRVDATPPAGWGERWSVRGRFTQPLLARPGDWRRWSGELHAELPRADVAQLRRHVDLPFELTEGDGALRAWLEVRRGQPQALTLDVALREVSMRLAPRLQRLVFEQVEGRVVARQDRDALQFELRQLGFTTGEGLVWPRSDLSVSLRHRERSGGPVAPVPSVAPPAAAVPASAAATAASVAPAPASAASAAELEAEAEADGEHRFLAISPSSEIVSGELSASRLDVGLLAAVAGRVPLGDPVRQALERLAPQGIVEGLQARWEGPLDQPSRYSVNARLSGVQVAAGAVPATGLGRPGVRGATVDLEASESGGRAVVAIEQGALVLPGALEDPTVPLQRLSGRVDWRLQTRPESSPQLEVRLSDVKLANADLQGQVEGTWRTGPGDGFGRGGRFPGELDLKAQVQRLQAVALARYLPLGLSEETRRYVGRAARSGTLSDVSIRVRGDLWSAPYPGGIDGGIFRIEGRLDDVGFAYLPSEPGWKSPWPEATRVRGRLLLDGDRIQWNNLQARLGGLELSRVAGAVQYGQGEPQLTLDGQARGGLSELLRFVQTTPVGEWLGGALARSTGAGAATLGLKLEMPLRDSRKARVRGSLQLAGNELRIRPDVPALSNARGRVDFTERGFTLAGTRAVVTGGETVIEGGFQPETGLRLSAQGSATAEGLRRATELGVVATLAERARGTSSYRLNLAIQQGRTELALNSSLVGLAFNLPSPLDKAADVPMPLSLQIRPVGVPGAAPASATADRDQLDLSLGRVLQLRALRDTSGASARLLQLAAAVGAGEPLPAPVAGGQATVRLDRLDVDAWVAALEAPSTYPATGTPAATPADAAIAAPEGEPGLPELMPRRIRVAVRELLVQERRLERVQAQLAQDAAGTWRAEIEAVQLAGRVEWRPAAGSGPSGDPGRVQARLSRLSLPPSESAAVESLLDQPRSSLPALDVVIDDFELRGKRLGKLEVEAVHQPLAVRAGGGEWRLRRFVLANPDAILSATGSWGAPLPAMGEPGPAGAAGAARRMRLAFQMQLKDSGALLTRLGFGEVLRGGNGRLEGEVSWLGSPLSLNTATLQGKLQLALEEGRFLKADPGAARLLGVLSLQALPRRLLLDFRDVFQEGFVFDEATADAVIEAGVARTNNFRMRGVQAAVLLEGTADIGRETQDLRVVVVPEINAGTASLAYAAINPAIGLGSFLAQLIFRRPLIAANTREFAVTGTWNDPKVERLDRIEKEAEAAVRANPPSTTPAPTPAPAPTTPNPPPRSAP